MQVTIDTKSVPDVNEELGRLSSLHRGLVAFWLVEMARRHPDTRISVHSDPLACGQLCIAVIDAGTSDQRCYRTGAAYHRILRDYQ